MMSQGGHSPSSLKGHGDWRNRLMAGSSQLLHAPFKNAQVMSRGTKGSAPERVPLEPVSGCLKEKVTGFTQGYYDLHRCINSWLKNQLDGEAQKTMVNVWYSVWRSRASRVLQGSVLQPALFNPIEESRRYNGGQGCHCKGRKEAGAMDQQEPRDMQQVLTLRVGRVSKRLCGA
ncbi:hypothetical protein QYF61_023717 [Mycteria americana]|uniref:Uncharacterized protein n=1 Tax=Mycteria americana TaxID=33587 RepID=A0AAN7MKE6_MYCAM|nr:hypothetical protein QYF61_023717 [Mycteria americana]